MNEDEVLKQIERRSIESDEMMLFDVDPDWKTIWWGMPDFENKIIAPQYTLNVHFLTAEDRSDYAQKLGIKLTGDTISMWWPPQERLQQGAFVYTGEKTNSRYPVCIPSKGRADCQTTGKYLDELGVDHWFFVEEHEYDDYCKHNDHKKVVKMPFSNLGQGSIPARNFIWDWAIQKGVKRHWTVDDNIQGFFRTHMTRRLRVAGGGFFNAMEDFVDRYENIAMAGPHNIGFCSIGWSDKKPFHFNSRVYSCILLDTSLPHRWRGRYNEDTDLSLRLLKDGHCTVLFNALLMNKGVTHGAKGTAMKGGNTDNVYNTGDHRLAFANSLKEQHPDCVEVVWKYNRWHHQVDYSAFKNNKPILKKNITPVAVGNNYGMRLAKIK